MAEENPLIRSVESDRVLRSTQYWLPPVQPWLPHGRAPNSSLRVACVVEDRLYHGLRFEGETLLLTPGNWKRVLDYGKPDLLLMESIWTTATGDWHLGQSPAALGQKDLLDIISLASKHSIPTVFWITKGHEYHEHFKDFSKHFDSVFCADPREVELLLAEGVQARELLPCVQPALYNPFRLYADYDSLNIEVLFDGWADLDRLTDELRALERIEEHGLSIIESRYQVFRSRLDLLPQYRDCILGCVTHLGRISALKYAKAYVTFDRTLSTQTTQQWMTLEAAASRVPVVHHGALIDEDIRKQVVIECPDEKAFQIEFVRFKEDDLYRQRAAHLGWRNVHEHHTFSHRLQSICKIIDLEHDWIQNPKVSMITPSYRREMLSRCIETFDRQTYPNKEMILILNGIELPSTDEATEIKSRRDLRIATVPEELFAGACLNQGHLLAQGDYCFRIDDDDYYGPNYILDMMLHARSIDVDFFGKPLSIYYYFVDEDSIFLSQTVTKQCTILSAEDIVAGRRFSGNTVSGKTSFFRNNEYSDFAQSAADLIMIYNSDLDDQKIAVMDNLNMVSERRDDQKTHTWKMDKEKLKKNMKYISNEFSDIMI